MTFNQLQYALSLRTQGSFKKAASHVGISQPALSLQIQKLEEEIGFKLFNRNVTPIEATEEGHFFLRKAQEVIIGMKRLEDYTSEIKKDFSGNLTIGIIPTLAPYLVPFFISSIRSDYPDLRIVIREQLTETIINNIRNGTLDVGIISTPIDLYGIKFIPLFYERFYVYISGMDIKKEYSIADIASNKLWLLDEGNCFRDQINDFCDLSSIREGESLVYQSNSIDALIRIVDSEGGMTILPELSTLALNEYQEENLKTISGRTKAREISMIVTEKYDKERYVEVLGTYIKSNIPHHMHELHDYEIVDPNIKIK